MISYIIKGIIPILIFSIVTYGIIKKVKVYDCFIEGVKDGIALSLRVFPYILAMLVAVNLFKESGALKAFINITAPIVKFIGLPPEILPLVLIKPLSGSGALGIYTDIVKTFGPDTFIGIVASIIMGTTETIFYTISVYLGSAGVKKIRHTLWAALLTDFTALIISLMVARAII